MITMQRAPAAVLAATKQDLSTPEVEKTLTGAAQENLGVDPVVRDGAIREALRGLQQVRDAHVEEQR
jgi:hypothetical protein